MEKSLSLQHYYNRYNYSGWNGPGGRFYIGVVNNSEKYIGKIVVNTNNLVISKSSTLKISFTSEIDIHSTGMLTAFLTTTDYSAPKYVNVGILQGNKIGLGDRKVSGRKVSFEISTDKIKANETYYIYILETQPVGQGNWSNFIRVSSPTVRVTLTYESYSKVSTPIITSITASTFVDGRITLTWSRSTNGNNNTLKSYRIHWINDTYSGTVDIGNTTSYTFSDLHRIFTCSKGNRLDFQVQGVGTVENYDSDWSNTASCDIVNKPPIAPEMQIIGKVRSNGMKTNVILKITKESYDIDGDSLVYYYFKGSEAPTQIVPGENVALELQKSDTITYYAFDGTEKSASKIVTPSINQPPIINSIAAQPNKIVNNYIAKATFLADVNSSTAPLNFLWNISTLDGKGKAEFTNGDNVDLLQYDNLRGKELKIQLTVTDSLGEQSISDSITIPYKIPSKLAIRSQSLEIMDNSLRTKTQLKDFFVRKIKITYWLEKPSVSFKKVVLKCGNNEIYSSELSSDLNTEEAIFKIIDFTEVTNLKLEHNKKYSFTITAQDSLGQEISKEIGSFLYSPLPIFSPGSTISVAKDSWKPLSQEQKFSLPKATFISEINNNNNNGIFFRFFTSSSSNPLGGSELFWQSDSAGAINWYTIREGASGLEDVNKKETVTYSIHICNEGGDFSVVNIENKEIDFKEQPFWQDETKITLSKGWRIKERDTYYVNSNEEISIETSKATFGDSISDLNINDSPSFFWKIFVDGTEKASGDFKEKHTEKILKLNLASFKGQLLSEKGVREKLVILKIYGRDSTEQTTQEGKTIKIQYQLAQPPIFTIQNCTVTAENTLQLKLKFQDTGAVDGKFSNYESITGRLIFADEDQVWAGFSFPTLSTIENGEVEISNITSDTITKIDTREPLKVILTLKTNVNTNANIIAESSVYVLYLNAPLVSYRPHWLGINNSDYEEVNSNTGQFQDVLKVDGFEKRQLILLRGQKGKDPHLISINLSNGKISGITIDCGTWDKI